VHSLIKHVTLFLYKMGKSVPGTVGNHERSTGKLRWAKQTIATIDDELYISSG
jgi:hypothetical protein